MATYTKLPNVGTLEITEALISSIVPNVDGDYSIRLDGEVGLVGNMPGADKGIHMINYFNAAEQESKTKIYVVDYIAGTCDLVDTSAISDASHVRGVANNKILVTEDLGGDSGYHIIEINGTPVCTLAPIGSTSVRQNVIVSDNGQYVVTSNNDELCVCYNITSGTALYSRTVLNDWGIGVTNNGDLVYNIEGDGRKLYRSNATVHEEVIVEMPLVDGVPSEDNYSMVPPGYLSHLISDGTHSYTTVYFYVNGGDTSTRGIVLNLDTGAYVVVSDQRSDSVYTLLHITDDGEYLFIMNYDASIYRYNVATSVATNYTTEQNIPFDVSQYDIRADSDVYFIADFNNNYVLYNFTEGSEEGGGGGEEGGGGGEEGGIFDDGGLGESQSIRVRRLWHLGYI